MFVSSVWLPWPSRACFMALDVCGFVVPGATGFPALQIWRSLPMWVPFFGGLISMDPSYESMFVSLLTTIKISTITGTSQLFSRLCGTGYIDKSIELITTIHLLVVTIFIHALVLRPNRSPHENGPKFLGTLRLIKRGNRKSIISRWCSPQSP